MPSWTDKIKPNALAVHGMLLIIALVFHFTGDEGPIPEMCVGAIIYGAKDLLK